MLNLEVIIDFIYDNSLLLIPNKNITERLKRTIVAEYTTNCQKVVAEVIGNIIINVAQITNMASVTSTHSFINLMIERP